MSTMTGGDLNLIKPELTDDHKVTIGTDLPANFQAIDDAFTARRLPNKNILHNWDFQIWQRGDSIPLVSTGISADRWRVWQDGFQASKQVDVDGRRGAGSGRGDACRQPDARIELAGRVRHRDLVGQLAAGREACDGHRIERGRS